MKGVLAATTAVTTHSVTMKYRRTLLGPTAITVPLTGPSGQRFADGATHASPPAECCCTEGPSPEPAGPEPAGPVADVGSTVCDAEHVPEEPLPASFGSEPPSGVFSGAAQCALSSTSAGTISRFLGRSSDSGQPDSSATSRRNACMPPLASTFSAGHGWP